MEIVQLGFLNKLPDLLGEKAEAISRLQAKTAAEKIVNRGFKFSYLF